MIDDEYLLSVLQKINISALKLIILEASNEHVLIHEVESITEAQKMLALLRAQIFSHVVKMYTLDEDQIKHAVASALGLCAAITKTLIESGLDG